jgi:hypothetical protein
MTPATTPRKPNVPPHGDLPYAPSPFDRLFDWVDALPGPYWLPYVIAWLALLAMETIVSGSLSSGGITATHLVLTGSSAYALYVMHTLDLHMPRALEQFRATMQCSDSEWRMLRYRMMTMPTLPMAGFTALGLVSGILFYVLVPIDTRFEIFELARTPESTHFNHALGLIIFAVSWVLLYHVRHQFNIVRDILSHHLKINVFDLRPVFALSRLSALTSIFMIIYLYMWLGIMPDLVGQPFVAVPLVVLLLVSAVSFAFPFVGVHSAIRAQKVRLLRHNRDRMTAMSALLHQRVDTGNIREMDDLSKAISSLEFEFQVILRIPTWPWQPETARSVVAALLFPFILWLLQFLTARFVIL